MKVFFYGLFMDESLLARDGVTAKNAVVGFVDGFCLTIGERATLQRRDGARAYGVMMEVAAGELDRLYANKSVAEYVPEAVTVEFSDGSRSQACCYNLPGDKVTGINTRYAVALLAVARRWGLPESYLEQIRLAGRPDQSQR